MDIELLQTYYRVNETSNAFRCFILLKSLGKYEGLFTKHTRLFQDAFADVQTQIETALWQSADRISSLKHIFVTCANRNRLRSFHNLVLYLRDKI